MWAFQPTVMPDAVGTPGREHGRKRGEASAEPWQTGALEGWAEEEVLQRRLQGGKHSRRTAEKAGVTEAGPQEPAEGPLSLGVPGHQGPRAIGTAVRWNLHEVGSMPSEGTGDFSPPPAFFKLPGHERSGFVLNMLLPLHLALPSEVPNKGSTWPWTGTPRPSARIHLPPG